MPAGFDTQATSQMTKSSQEQALKNSNTFGDAGGVWYPGNNLFHIIFSESFWETLTLRFMIFVRQIRGDWLGFPVLDGMTYRKEHNKKNKVCIHMEYESLQTDNF